MSRAASCYKVPRQTLITKLLSWKASPCAGPFRISCLHRHCHCRRHDAFPYKACVTADDVYVRSGPGDNYYPTDKLKAGTEVEVYRHDPGGWFAIRPPKGSFSWVSSRHLQFDGNHLATVSGERVAARVGSRLSDLRDVIQVRLHNGEAVEVVEPRRNAQSGDETTAAWCKIAPPSGEFRWVSGRFVDPDYQPDGLRKTLPAERSI